MSASGETLPTFNDLNAIDSGSGGEKKKNREERGIDRMLLSMRDIKRGIRGMEKLE